MDNTTSCASMARKLFTLLAFACLSIQGWADTQYCEHEITGVTHGHKMSVTYKALGSNQYTLILTSKDAFTSYNTGSNFYTEVNNVAGTQVSANLVQDGNTLTFTVTSNPKPNVYVGDFYVNYSDGEEHYNIPTDEDWTATCTSGDLTPSALSLNSTAETLDANNSKTFTIVPTTAVGYDGTVTYTSSNTGIASVSSSGVVTAVGRGTATITVNAPATASFAASSATFTATVLGPINWNAANWIGNGSGDAAYTDKFKMVDHSYVNIQHPGFASQAGIYAEFAAPINYCSLGDGNYAVQGGGIVLYLSAFTAQQTEVAVIANHVHYVFYVYNADGSGTFNLADATPSRVYDTNFALETNGGCSSATSGTAWNANDGNNGTSWESTHGVDAQTWTLDMTQRRIFNTVQLRWQDAYGKAFTIDVSNDGLSWTTVKSVSETLAGFPYEQTLEFDEQTARFVRFNGIERGTQWGYNLFEFRVLLPGVSVLTSIDLSAPAKVAQVNGTGLALTAQPKDQNGQNMDETVSYQITPETAGHMSGNMYIPDQNGIATIRAFNGTVYSSALTVYGYSGSERALSTNISTDNKVVDQSEVTGNATDAFYAVDGNYGSVWQACRDLADNNTNANFTSFFTLDLGDFYDVNLIVIWFDGAASDVYTIEFSEDNSNWNTGYSISQSVGNYTHQKYLTSDDLVENNKVRYVRFTTTKASTTNGWGMKIFEMQVYGTDWVDTGDTENPVLTAATLSSQSFYEAVINVAATDNVAVTRYHVVDNAHGIDLHLTASDGKITIPDLIGITEYHFSITAMDAANNESNVIVVNVTIQRDESMPWVNAPTPIERVEGVDGDVRPVYSDAYTSILAHGFALQNWGSVTGTERVIDGNHFLQYNVADGNAVIWGKNDASADAIVANAGYNAGGDGDNTGIDARGMTYLHLDIWSKVAMNGIEIRINDDIVRRINLTNAGWQQFNIGLADPVETLNLATVRWFKITNIVDANRQKLAFDNIYFYKDPDDAIKPVMTSASLVSTTGASATINVAATDNYEVASFHVVDGSHNIDETCVPTAGRITVTGLTGGTTYNFTISALDPAGNESDNSVVVQATTLNDSPSGAAPTPQYNASVVKAFYSATYGATAMTFGEWNSGTTQYDDTYAKKYVTAASGYFGNQVANMDCSDMDALHIDIWAADNMTIKLTPILWNTSTNANYAEHGEMVNIEGGRWNAITLPLNEGNLAAYTDWTNVYQLKVSEAPNTTLWLDNIYFTKALSFDQSAITQSTLDGYNGWLVDVAIARPMPADGQFKTICFPFSMTAAQVAETFSDCEILRLSEAHMKSENEMYIQYAPVSTIEAGYPYLITLNGDDQSGLDFKGVTINSATTNNTISKDAGDGKAIEMIGTFTQASRSAQNEYYLDVADNMLHSIGLYCTNNSRESLTIPAFRCYFRLTGFSNPNSVCARIVRHKDVATDIEQNTVQSVATKQILNGTLFIIRDGVRYTVTGVKVE